MNMVSTVYVVDDDQAIRDLIAAMAKGKGYESQTFATGDEFLTHVEGKSGAVSGAAVVDVKLPGMNGLELLQKLNERKVQLPVIMITGYADVPLAVDAMRAGAVTFLEKPFQNQDLWQHIEDALAEGERLRQDQQRKATIETRFAELTNDEVAVMMKMLRGMPNKRIAAELDIGLRTVELRRANVLKKMQVESLAELVRLAMLANKMPSFDDTTP